ncbi:MAG: autotransporter domain-containing protein [Sphingobium sp.]
MYTIVEAGGIVAPGTDGVGSLTFSGELLLTAGSQLHFQIGAPGSADNPGTSDRIIMTENAHLSVRGRPELHFSDAGGAGIGYYRLISTTGGQVTFPEVEHLRDAIRIVTPGPVSDAGYEIVVNTNQSRYNFDLLVASANGGPDPVTGDPSLQYWRDSGVVWNGSGTDWRNSGGTTDVAWAGNHGVFNGAGSAVAVEGAQSFKGLQFVTSGYTLGGAGTLATVAGGSELRVLGGEAATIAAVIAGDGGITKTQDGTLALAGVNSYTGRTIVEGGTLALQGSGSIEASSDVDIGGSGIFTVSDVMSGATRIGSLSGSGIVSLGATDLHVTQKQAASFDGTMTGTGDFSLSGPETLVVTGVVSVGLTSISADSTLQIGSGVTGTGGQVSNDIHNDGTLVINRGDTGYWDGTLSGTGHLVNRGPGTTIFAGDSSLFTGAVDLEAGKFSLAESGVLGTSLLRVANGAMLGGTGRVAGDVLVGSGGRFAPGNSIGTFSVAGDVTFAAGSIYDVEIAANGDSDRIATTASAALQGGTVQVTALDPHVSYRDGQQYTILSADGGVTGTFNDVTMLNHSAFITPTLEHDSHAVRLSIAMVREFDTAAETFNQHEAARGLFNFDQTPGSDALAVFNSIAGLNAQAARDSFDLSSGEIYSSSHYAIAEAADLFTRTIQRRAGTMPAASGKPAPWLAFMGQSGRHDADGNAARLSSRAYGLAGGIDLVNGDLGGSGTVRLGLAAGYLDGRATVDARRSEADYNSTLVGAYLTLSSGSLHVSNAFSLGWHDLDTERRIAWGAPDRTATASRDARTVGYSAALRYDLPIGALRLSPLATLDIANVQFKAARETGAGALNLDLTRENFTAASVGAGAEIGFATQAFDGSIRVLYDHQIGDAVPRQRAALSGSGQSHMVLGPKMRDGGVSTGAALAYRLSGRATITASYDGTFNSDASNHKGSIAITVGF